MYEKLWKKYAQIWQQTEQSRMKTMSEVLTSEVIYRDPQIVADGITAFSEYIAGFQKNYAGCGFVIKEVKGHNDRSLAHWDCTNDKGEILFEGTSFAVINSEGKFTELNGFYPASE